MAAPLSSRHNTSRLRSRTRGLVVATALVGWSLALAPSTGLAGVYSWVDSQGAKHYSDRPPPGAKSREVKVRVPAPRSASAPQRDSGSDPDTRARKRERLLQSFAADRERRKQATADAREKREAMHTACERSRATLLQMSEARSLVRTAANGAQIHLSEQERALAIASATRRVSDSCS